MPITDGSSQALVGKLGVFVGMDYLGKVEFIFNKTIPAGKIPAFGTEYSRTTYNKLWEEVQRHPEWMLTETAWQEFYKNNNGQVPYYSDGNGSTTFRTPRLTGFPEGAGSLEEVGTVKEAGLPNITGEVGANRLLDSAADYVVEKGALFLGGNIYGAVPSAANGTVRSIEIDASRSSSVYGKSDTVQPPSIVGMWVITAFVAVTGISSTALDNIVSGVTELETRVGKVEATDKEMVDYVVETYTNETSWYRKYKSGWVVQGGKQANQKQVTLLKPMKDTNYDIKVNVQFTASPNTDYESILKDTITTTGFQFRIIAAGLQQQWRVEGYAQ